MSNRDWVYLEMELLGHMVTLYVNFYGTAWWLSSVAAAFYILARSVWRLLILTSLLMLFITHLFHPCHPGGCDVVSHCGFICISRSLMMSSIFLGCYWPFIYLPCRSVFSDLFKLKFGLFSIPVRRLQFHAFSNG